MARIRPSTMHLSQPIVCAVSTHKRTLQRGECDRLSELSFEEEGFGDLFMMFHCTSGKFLLRVWITLQISEELFPHLQAASARQSFWLSASLEKSFCLYQASSLLLALPHPLFFSLDILTSIHTAEYNSLEQITRQKAQVSNSCGPTNTLHTYQLHTSTYVFIS